MIKRLGIIRVASRIARALASCSDSLLSTHRLAHVAHFIDFITIIIKNYLCSRTVPVTMWTDGRYGCPALRMPPQGTGFSRSMLYVLVDAFF